MDYPEILDQRFTVRGTLRCDGVGGMLLAETKPADAAGPEAPVKAEGLRVAVRWFPPHASGEEALVALRKLPVHPTLPKLVASGADPGCAWAAFDFPDGELLDARQAMAATRLADLGASNASA